jgi:hypothetical protein
MTKISLKRLENERILNAKAYWKMLRGTVVNKSNNCSLSSNYFQHYFKVQMILIQTFYQPDEDVLYFNNSYLDGEFNIMFSELNIPFSNPEIIKTCKNLNSWKSAGSYYLLNEIFKNDSRSTHFVNVLNNLFDKIFDFVTFRYNGPKALWYRFIKWVT